MSDFIGEIPENTKEFLAECNLNDLSILEIIEMLKNCHNCSQYEWAKDGCNSTTCSNMDEWKVKR